MIVYLFRFISISFNIRKINTTLILDRLITILNSPYMLIASINHYGDLDSGHYKSVIFNETEYYLYDDNIIKKYFVI